MFFKKQLLLAALFALALFGAAPDHARAQGCGQQNPNCIVPTAPVGTSNNQAASTAFVQNQLGHGIPYTAITGLPADTILGSIAGGAASALTPTQVTTFCNVFSTALSGCVPAPLTVSGRYLGDDQGWHAAAVQQIVQGAGIALTGTCSGAALNCSVATSGTASPVLASRTSAITQNLSTFSAISTLGYAAAGDGGVGTFVKITGNFRDSYTTGASVTSNGGTCTNGTYLGQFFTGGHGVNFQGNITVSGGNAALANILDYGGNGYSVGDVLTVISPVGGCSPQVTISAVSTALASFTDSVGTKFQYIPNNGYSNPLAFGCKFNWLHATGDGAATDDTACVRDVMAFASFATPNNLNFTDQPFASNIVLFPPGTSLLSTTSTPACSLCGTGIIQPNGVIAQGAGATNTIFKAPDAGITANFWNLCDVNRQLACFGTAIRDIGLTATTSAPTIGGIYMLFSNADQQLEAVRNIQIYDGQYGCFRYNTGFGGAATFTLYNFFCTHQNNDVDAIVINSSGTMFEFQTLIAEGASTSTNAFTLLNGHVHIMGFHTEGIANGFNINAPASSSSLTLEHASGGNGCTSLMTLQSTNSPGNVALFDTYKNGCGTLVIDGQPASPGNRTADVIPANGWVAFNP